MVMATIVISIAASLVTATIITILGCWTFRCWLEREVNRILDEEGMQIEDHVIQVIELAKESIRDAHLNK